MSSPSLSHRAIAMQRDLISAMHKAQPELSPFSSLPDKIRGATGHAFTWSNDLYFRCQQAYRH